MYTLRKSLFEIFPFLHIIRFHELKAPPEIKDKNFDNFRTIQGFELKFQMSLPHMALH